MTLDLLGLNRGMNVDILGNIGIKILTDVTYATRQIIIILIYANINNYINN
jgi:hypothetical protein